MAKNNTRHKAKISTNKNRKDMKRPAKKPVIVRFANESVQENLVQVPKAQEIKMQEVKKQGVEGQGVERQWIEEQGVEKQGLERQKIENRQETKRQEAEEQGAERKETEKQEVGGQAVGMEFRKGLTLDMVRVNDRMRKRIERRDQPQMVRPAMTAREIKEREIQKAISAANRSIAKQEKDGRQHKKMGFGFHRVAFAVVSAAVAVFAVVCFVNANSPNISGKVEAMQIGINAHYPGYIPRGYSLTDITTENGRVVLNFKNSSTDGAFSLIEEKSSWNTDDLYANFVEANYGENYIMISGDEFKIYVSGSNAAWVRGGVFYRITTTAGSLTKKQISTIAAKL